MNDAKAVQAVLDDLSASKLSAYKKLGLKDDWEVIQSYLFLLDLAGYFVVPLQLLELALRNKMHRAISTQTGQAQWFNTVPFTWMSKKQVTDAKNDAASEGKTGDDDVICRLMFGFWVYMTDKPYRPSGKGTNLWQFIKGDVFPGATVSMGQIFDELKAINDMRNRLFHHEPLWKLAGHQTMDQAIARTRTQYDRVLKVLGWISPEKVTLIKGLGLTTKFYTACDPTLFQPTPMAVPEPETAEDTDDKNEADAENNVQAAQQPDSQSVQPQTITTQAA